MKKATSKEPYIAYVALLRGINVGGHKIIKMDALRKAFEALKFKNVRTLLASGNVIFEATEADEEALTGRIEKHLEKTFGHEVGVMLRTLASIQKIVDAEPYKGVTINKDTRLYVTFMDPEPKRALPLPYDAPLGDYRILSVAERAVFSVYTVTPGQRLSNSMDVLAKFGSKMTTRNFNTVLKLLKPAK